MTKQPEVFPGKSVFTLGLGRGKRCQCLLMFVRTHTPHANGGLSFGLCRQPCDGHQSVAMWENTTGSGNGAEGSSRTAIKWAIKTKTN